MDAPHSEDTYPDFTLTAKHVTMSAITRSNSPNAISRADNSPPVWTHQQVAILKSQIAPKATDDELVYFGSVCQRLGLDPFSRQIYAIHRSQKNGPDKMTIQVSIDGLRALAARTGLYAGSEAPTFDEGLSLYQAKSSGRKKPTTALVTVWKIVGGHRCPFVGEVALEEFDQNTFQWQRMPYNLLAKCAEAQALRKAFPSELSGLEVMDEQPPVAQVRPVDELFAMYRAMDLSQKDFEQFVRRDAQRLGKRYDSLDSINEGDVSRLVGVRLGEVGASLGLFGEDYEAAYKAATEASGQWIRSTPQLVADFQSRNYEAIGRAWIQHLDGLAAQLLAAQKEPAAATVVADPEF